MRHTYDPSLAPRDLPRSEMSLLGQLLAQCAQSGKLDFELPFRTRTALALCPDGGRILI